MASTYRPDIDGLRALAVIPVVLFHSGFDAVKGGFVGVDVFFVISGFLITRILLDDIHDGRFSIAGFYERRVRRIFPALFVVLVFSTVAAAWMLTSGEFLEYASSLAASAFFFSNYYFMFDAGYFAAPSETRPLLHIWSLAVEEQFYIVFPLLLFLLAKIGKRAIGLATIALLVASLSYGIWLVDSAPTDAFYSTPGRGWQLMVGALLALYPVRRALPESLANGLGIVGLVLIGYSIVAFSELTAFPGLAATVPVLGAALILFSGARNDTWAARLLSTSPARITGLISYSMYLWHWPLLVFYRQWSISPVTNGEVTVLIVIIVILSYLSWRFVEQPFRNRALFGGRERILALGVGVMLVLGAMSLLIMNGNGFPGRHSEQVARIQQAENDRWVPEPCRFVPTRDNGEVRLCSIGADREPSFAVWGDSHGQALAPAVGESARRADRGGVFFGRGGCPTLLGVTQARQGFEACDDEADAFIAFLAEHPEIRHVVLISRWSLYAMGVRFQSEPGDTVYIRDAATSTLSLDENVRVFNNAFERTLSALSRLGRRVTIVEQVPEAALSIPQAAARKLMLGRRLELRPAVSDYIERQKLVTTLFNDTRYAASLEVIRPQARLCGDEYCEVMHDGVPIYWDSSHLTATHARRLSNVFDSLWLEGADNAAD